MSNATTERNGGREAGTDDRTVQQQAIQEFQVLLARLVAREHVRRSARAEQAELSASEHQE